MKALVLDRAAGLENLKLVDRDVPKPGPKEVLLRMKAASLNYRDLMTVTAAYGMSLRLPMVPLSDGCGEVIETGPGVTRVKKGDLVAPTFFQGWLSGPPMPGIFGTALGGAIDGCAQEYLCLSEDGVTPAPKNLSPEEVACLPCAALTAWNALVNQGGIKAGDMVLVQGTGGVSLFGMQFAKAFGAQAIVTSSSDEKLARAKELGADMLINYRSTPKWEVEARKMTGGRGVDHILEVGGAGTLQKSINAARVGGHVAIIGGLSGIMSEVSLMSMIGQAIKISGIGVGSRIQFEDMTRAIEMNDIHPAIDRRHFSLQELPKALALMKEASHFGKIVVKIG
jgi:NADPH:quinone reductase-like Zn-dependent oxidoreductase